MEQLVAQRENPALKPANTPFLAVDAGGTHARVGLVQADDAGSVAVLAYRKYNCAQYPDLTTVLRTFIDQEAGREVDEVVIACAGKQVDGVIINSNLPWPVSIVALRELKIPNLGIINDFEAIAHATRYIDPDIVIPITGPESGEAGKPIVAVGPGTGLGSAVYIPGDPEPTVLATEAGHISFAPCTAREREVLTALAGRDTHVSCEQVLSGPGLVTLYNVLAEMSGEQVRFKQPSEITAAALAGSNATAVETLKRFCALLGSFVGNLALLYGAGSVYLTGGILPRMHDFLRRSDFTARFLDKGAMRTFLERIPVRLVTDDQLGVIGAAGWSIEHRKNR